MPSPLPKNCTVTISSETDVCQPVGLKKHLARAIRYNDAHEAAGSSIEFEFTGSTPQESIAHRIKQLMKQRGLTQRGLATSLKVSAAVISRILRHPSRSKLDTLSRIARALNVHVRQLV